MFYIFYLSSTCLSSLSLSSIYVEGWCRCACIDAFLYVWGRRLLSILSVDVHVSRCLLSFFLLILPLGAA
ncbi:hypothetical protein CSUI_001840 [Cystoisospora suis]|uniref:Uncharacterized protein n=1 Tax=Cystoisospora suis TaxID=483139 RepID=A0A2C6L8W7_9APIC|nr:hypothetical protein CSUI_001840 [Cystoisospora suis]